MHRVKKLTIIAAIIITLASAFHPLVFAQTATPDPNATATPTPTPDKSKEIEELTNRIKELEGKVKDLQSQKTSLSSQISLMDNQIELTEYRIRSTEQQIKEITQDIQSASNRIKSLEGSVDNMTKVFLNRVVAAYQVGGVEEPIQAFLSSKDASEFISRSNYLRIVQEHDKQLLYDTVQAKNDYANQKNIFETKKQKVESLQTQLQDYNDQLDKDKQEKERLLQVTKNDETKYQAMLNQARAQINAFKSFATSRVGSGGSIIPAQASPDGWYYNQRDERWGNNYIGTSSEQVWEVGCLLTSMAMVMKKHGAGVTPANVAANTSYFFSSTAYMLIPWAGGQFSSTWGYSQSDVDSKLASGEPVIVGVKAGNLPVRMVQRLKISSLSSLLLSYYTKEE
jgi:peptidoglycan hydrolase CwlO-like protein